MNLTMSMFSTQTDYWKARAEQAEKTVQETAKVLGCAPGNEEMLMQAERLREGLRRLREWGGLTSQRYSATIAFGVTDWIDGGMVGDLPALPDYATTNTKVSGAGTASA